jgi:preprotein translocase subunit SecE
MIYLRKIRARQGLFKDQKMTVTNNKIFRYFKESKDELRKVTWPSRKEAIKHTLIVIGVSISVAVFLGLADYLLNLGLEQLIK